MRHLKKTGAAAGLLATAALLFNGCAGAPKVPSPDLRSRFGKIGVVALPAHPKGNFLTVAGSRVGGTAKGASAGAFEGWLEGMKGLGPSAADPISAAAAGLGLLLGVVIGAAVGGIGGATEAIPAHPPRRSAGRSTTRGGSPNRSTVSSTR